jgi:membrane fusion protein, type I secretion system
MQRPDDDKPRLSRGVSTRQSDADEAAFMDGVIPPLERIPPYRDAVQPVQNYNSIAVVVGKRRPAGQKPVSQKPLPSRPMSPRPVSLKSGMLKPVPQRPAPQKSMAQRPMAQRQPALRDPPRPMLSRVPALLAGTAAVTRTTSGAMAVAKRAYGAVFDADGRQEVDAAEQDGLKSYLVQSFENQRRAGGRMLAVALIVGGGWATMVPLSGAVVVPGTVVSASSVKKIQHQTGGIVAGIAITEGMRVREGDILVRLDDTQVRSSYEQLRSKIGQLNEQIGGMSAQIKSRQTESGLIAQELEGVQKLWDQRLVPLTRLTSLQREAARIDGEKAQLVSAVAETRGKIGEAELQLTAAKEQVSHIDLRAPVSGIVHQLSIHTVGGVVSPAEVMMVIVPESDELQLDAHLPPDQIDQVHKGQNAQVRFSAFNQRTTPELTGVVSHVSADITRDQQTSAGYYTVRVSLSGQELARLGDGQQLVAGMPAELYIQTTSRTMMNYLFKPITEQLNRMFRER